MAMEDHNFDKGFEIGNAEIKYILKLKIVYLHPF